MQSQVTGLILMMSLVCYPARWSPKPRFLNQRPPCNACCCSQKPIVYVTQDPAIATIKGKHQKKESKNDLVYCSSISK